MRLTNESIQMFYSFLAEGFWGEFNKHHQRKLIYFVLDIR